MCVCVCVDMRMINDECDGARKGNFLFCLFDGMVMVEKRKSGLGERESVCVCDKQCCTIFI